MNGWLTKIGLAIARCKVAQDLLYTLERVSLKCFGGAGIGVLRSYFKY
jgi:hypothetical protein